MSQATSEKKANAGDLDVVLKEIGEFKWNSIRNYLIISIPTALATTLLANFIFTAAVLDYRCEIPECESSILVNRSVLKQVIPLTADNKLNRCQRYNSSIAAINDNIQNECNLNLFNRSDVIKCTTYVFKDNERRLSNEFGLECENEYKLAFVGVASNIGRFVSLPVSGYFSDRFGRLTLLIWGIVLSSVAGILQAFSFNYQMFIIMEFTVACMCTGILGAGFILIAEWVTTKNRVFALFLLGCANPVGASLMSLAAMYFSTNFKLYLLVIYAPGLLMWIIYWLADESPRWLISVQKFDKASQILENRAKANGKVLSPHSIFIIRKFCENTQVKQKDCTETNTTFQQISTVLLSGGLLLRFLALSLCWIVCSFIYYGISISSVQLDNDFNKYMSFMIVSWAEMPGMLFGWVALDRIGRRYTLFASFLTCGLAVLSLSLIGTSEDRKVFMIILTFVAKCAISTSFMAIYVFTTELWPTASRNTLMGLCSMIGRIGGMLSSVIILLGPTVPFYLFASAGLTAALIILTLPETLNRKLPDSVDDIK